MKLLQKEILYNFKIYVLKQPATEQRGNFFTGHSYNAPLNQKYTEQEYHRI